METFDQIADRAASEISSRDNGASQANESESTNSSTQNLGREQATEVAQALAELEKMEKFKFQGQEWTPKDLEKAILRQQDYTKKTQTLSQERKSFGDEQKYYENLAWDLMRLKENPSRINEFISIYPQKFHTFAENWLKANTQAQAQVGQQGQQVQSQAPQVPDVQLLSRLDRLEKFYNEQEISKNEVEIKRVMDSFNQKYPEAAPFRELVLGRAYEIHEKGTQLTEQVWEDIYKQVNEQVAGILKTQQAALFKKQQEANKKAGDVGAGGGSPGRAPQKFSKLSDVTKFAIEDLTRTR